MIEVRADDVRDTESRNQIRAHFRHIVQMFTEGNFRVPMLVHSQDVPGTEVMSERNNEIHWKLQKTPRGARIIIVADNKASLEACMNSCAFR